jgi:tripartite-type tricarboxylate transporter receptor subunit TctC
MKVAHRVFLRLLKVLGVALLAAPAAWAQAWPSKPIRVVVPYSAGSSTDILARKIGEPLSRALGQTIIVENKAGANSTLGTEFVGKSPGDGYTLLLGTNAGFAASPAGLVRNLRYDPIADFVPVIHVASIYHMLVVNKSVPADNVKDFITLLKANPGKYNFASGNTASFAYGEMFKKVAGVDVVHVPYKSSPEAITDLIGGRVQLMFTDPATGVPRIRAGQLKVLAAAEKRNAMLPELATMTEVGVEGFGDASGWFAFFAPAGTPRAAVDRLNREIATILHEPQMREWLLANGYTVATQTSPEALSTHLRSQIEYWKQIIRDFRLQPVGFLEPVPHG